jgi:hypothetical protein
MRAVNAADQQFSFSVSSTDLYGARPAVMIARPMPGSGDVDNRRGEKR